MLASGLRGQSCSGGGFLVARLDHALPLEGIRPGGQEGDWFVGARWVGLKELQSWEGMLFPTRMAELLPPILAGQLPPEPIDSGV